MMHDIANRIKDILITWSAISFLALLLETRLSTEAREKFASFILRLPGLSQPQIKSVGEFSSLYINNTIFRYFGDRPFAIKALFRSVLISLISFFILSGCIFYFYDFNVYRIIWNSEKLLWLYNKPYIVIAIAMIFLMDYITYIVTYFLMRYAANVQSFFQIIFISIVDSLSTIYVFLLIFPVVLSVLYVGLKTIPYRSAAIYGLTDGANESMQLLIENMIHDTGEIAGENLSNWNKFAAMDQESLGKLAGVYMLTAEVDPGGKVSDPVNGKLQVVPSLTSGSVALAGLLRYQGIEFKDLLQWLNGHITKAPDHDISSWVLPTDGSLSWFTIGYSQEWHNYFKMMWKSLQLFRIDYQISNQLRYRQPSRLMAGLRSLYQGEFIAAQAVQTGFFQVIRFEPLQLSLFPLKVSDEDLFGTIFLGNPQDEKLGRLYWTFCDDNFYLEVSEEKADSHRCSQRVIFVGKDLVESELSKLKMTEMRLPFGMFLATSASVTLVFYVSLFLFTAAGYATRFFALLIPEHVKRHVSGMRERRIVQVIFVEASFFATIILTVLAG